MRPPNPVERREQRRERILSLIEREQVRNQAELQDRLAAAGIVVDQATLSRDLRDLGVVKGKDGYGLPQAPLSPVSAQPSLWHAVHTWLLSATAAQNLVVLRTPTGGAQPLAVAFDHAELDGVIGTIAGDDTVLAICRSAAKAKALLRRLAPGAQRKHRGSRRTGS